MTMPALSCKESSSPGIVCMAELKSSTYWAAPNQFTALTWCAADSPCGWVLLPGYRCRLPGPPPPPPPRCSGRQHA